VTSPFWTAEHRFDWGVYVRDRGGVRALRSKPNEYLLQCPDCGKLKLAVNVGLKKWQCWTCGEGGHEASSLIAKAEALPWKDALVTVLTGHQEAIGRIDKLEDAPEVKPRRRRPPKEVPFPEGFLWLRSQSYGPLPHAMWPPQDAYFRAIKYCYERGIRPHVIDEMRLGVCASGRFVGRVIFPVFDSGGRLIFYQGRATWKEHPRERRHVKTLSPKLEEDFAGPGDCLLNLDFIVKTSYIRVLVVEGPIDCAHGWPDCVATFGKKISARQAELLVRAGIRELDLCWDNDTLPKEQRDRGLINGYEAALKMAPILSDVFKVRVVKLPPDRDPGDLSKDEIEQYRAQAVVWGSGERLMRL
jgi:hypothetical protein